MAETGVPPMRMPVLIRVLIAVHALVAAERLIVLTGTLFAPERFPVHPLAALFGLLLYLGIIWGILNRRRGAWALIPLLELLSLLTNGILLLARGAAFTPTARAISITLILVAIATVAYFLTPQAKRWFRIETQRAA